MTFLARLSLANRVLVILVSLVITGFGVIAVPALKQQLFPSLEFPAAFISAPYQGASPEIIEDQVTAPIEDAIRGVDGIEEVTSTSRDGVAVITAMFEFGTDIDAAVNQLQTAVNRIQSRLPQDVEPTVFSGGTDDIPAIVLAASASGDQRALAQRLETDVLPRLRAIDGVRDAAVTGARTAQIVITPDPAKLAAAGVSPQALTTTLQANGLRVPAGTVDDDDRTLTVQVGTPIRTIDELAGVYLTGRAGPVRLGDVATVAQQDAPAAGYTRTNGAASLGLTVTAAPDGNAVAISQTVREQLDELEQAAGAELTVVSDQAPFVERSIDSLTTEGVLGLIMAVIVILVFLLSLRSTLVTAVSIPLSVVVALIALWIGDYSLNLLTLGALTIAVGRVVDDSIVVLENIKRHLGYGEERRTAILTGVQEVAGAVTASTLTTVAVFAPIALVGGFVGQLFSPFAITVTVALLASLLVSLTVVPVLSYWFLSPAAGGSGSAEARRAAEEKELRSPLQRAYLPVIRFATKRRLVTLLVGLLVLLGTGALATRLETNFIDQSGQDTLSITQEMPVGTNLTATDAAAKRVETVLAGRASVKSYQVTVGSGEFNPFAGSGGAGRARYSVALAEGAEAVTVQDELRAEFAKLGPDAGEITVGGGQGGGGFNADQLAVVVRAADPAVLASATAQVRDAMSATANVIDVTDNLAASSPTVQVTVDRAKAARAGLTETAVGQSVAGVFRGAPLGRLTTDGTQRDVVLRFGVAPTDVAAVRALPLTTATGPVRLDSVATVTEVNGPVEITRIDGDRSATVTGTATGSNVGAATEDLTKRLTGLTLPNGASYEIGGVSADQAEAFGDLGLALLAAIAIVFIIMVATFHSFAQPLVLLVSVPFAATGAIGLLLATGTALGVPALIGMLMLVGIVVTNAIVLMDLINQYRAQGMGVVEAVVEGGRRRLRPILMTAVATIFALLPMALGLTGEGGFISQPLAIVVIGGLVSSTLLTLVLVPTLYTMVENRKERGRERRQRRAAARAAKRGGPADAPAAPGASESAAGEPIAATPAGSADTVGTSGTGPGTIGGPAGSTGPRDVGDSAADGSAPESTSSGRDTASGRVQADAVAPVDPEAGGTSAPAGPAKGGALRGYTDQFEVLRLPRKPSAPPA